LLMVEGSAYRVGQIGSFLRIPLGYTDLFGVCTQVGAESTGEEESDDPSLVVPEPDPRLSGFRWIQIALFGESTEGRFERGIGQFPTVGDEAHVVTARDLDVIYADRGDPNDAVVIGRIAGSDGVPAALRLSALVTRHASVVGSTGAGKSNLLAVLLRAFGSGPYRSARALVIDPHGEYGSALPERTRVLSTSATEQSLQLRVPYWALTFEELAAITMGPLREADAEFLRNRIRDLKIDAADRLSTKTPHQAITADSPIPFSLRRLWWELENNERMTFTSPNDQTTDTREQIIEEGDIAQLIPPRYPPASGKATAPHRCKEARGISRQLELMRNRMLDSSFAFMFDNADDWAPDEQGIVRADLDQLLVQWIGGDLPITVIDVSHVPASAVEIVVGSLLGIVYDALYWGMNLPVGGKQQPLLVVLDEAHRFLREGTDTAATRACERIAKEGRKYGIGLATVTQRPSDINPAVLSQAGTTIALRVTNRADRAAIEGTITDDLGGLTDLLPALRTGEALILGDALQVPSRVRVYKAPERPVGDDPKLPQAWLEERPDTAEYTAVVAGWRAQSAAADPHIDTDDQGEPSPASVATPDLTEEKS
jgi:DNA helicase HerA-like ATPase